MQPELHSLFASERLKDDHSGLKPEPEGIPTLEPQSITIRPLREDDVAAVERLAELEERRMPAGALLLADVEGTIEAAVSIESGEAVANPFAPSAGVVALLEHRAAQLRAA